MFAHQVAVVRGVEHGRAVELAGRFQHAEQLAQALIHLGQAAKLVAHDAGRVGPAASARLAGLGGDALDFVSFCLGNSSVRAGLPSRSPGVTAGLSKA